MLRLALLGLLMWVGLASAAIPARFDELRVENTPDGVYLYSQIQFDLPESVRAVMRKGIAVYFVAETRLMRERWYWFDKRVTRARRYNRLAYQPLTNRWRLNVGAQPIRGTELGLSLTTYYDSLAEALGDLKRINGWKIADPDDLADTGTQTLQFRFYLDADELPRTLQIDTSRSSDWHLSLERRIDLSPEPAS